MNDTKSTIELRYHKLYFIGLAGLGKTTFRKRLTGLLGNLSSLSPEERQRCSTYLAECTQVLAVTTGSKLNLEVSNDIDEETQLLFSYLYGSRSSDTEKHMAGPSVESFHPPVGKLIEPSLEMEDPGDSSEASEEEKITTKDIQEIFSRLRSLVGSGKYAEQLLGKILLNLIDMGGQPGFLEMLPFLSSGPGMYLVFFPLDKELDEYYQVSYERDGHRITPYEAKFTIRETISQILSAISHLYDMGDEELSAKIEGISSVQPRATLIGTFKDKLEMQMKLEVLLEKISSDFPEIAKDDVERYVKPVLHTRVGSLLEVNADDKSHHPSLTAATITCLEEAVDQHLTSDSFTEEVRTRLEKKLQEKHTALTSLISDFEDIMINPNDRHFFAVDNFEGTDEDIDPIRDHLQSIIENFFKDAKVRIRPAQLLLGIILRKEFDIASMNDCHEIGRELKMEIEDLEFTLWYLHRCVGALIHHPDIEDSWFKENIICSPNVVFNSISILIVKSLLELHSHSSDVCFVESERKNWTEKGQFSLETVERCHTEENEKKVREGKLIPVDKLVKLLQHVNLLAPITTTKRRGRREIVQTVYFMPAILECASPEELLKTPTTDANTPSSLKIMFELRYVPIGVFCAMISRLVSKGRDGILGMKWQLVDSVVKRNLVSFSIDSARHCVTLVAHVNCYEIRVSRQSASSIDLYDLCSYVLSTVLFVMKEISKYIVPIIAFDCPCGQHEEENKRDVSSLCQLSQGISTCFMCDHGSVSLTTSQEKWFAKEVQLGGCTSLKALPYAQAIDSSLSFSWSRKGSRIAAPEGIHNQLKVVNVTADDCTEYYRCEISKNGEPFFTVIHSLKCDLEQAKKSALPGAHVQQADCGRLNIETLKREAQVSDFQLDTEIEETDLHSLAGFFESSGTDYLIHLGLNKGQRADVGTRTYQQGTQAGMSLALSIWRERDPFKAKFRVLVNIFLKLGKGDAARNVCEYASDVAKIH